MEQRAALKTEPASYYGEITFVNGDSVQYSRTWSGLGGDRIPIERDPGKIHKSDRNVRLSTIRRIEFHPFSSMDRATLGLSSDSTRCHVRKVDIHFHDNTVYRATFMNTTLWEWYGAVESGGMSNLDIKTLTIMVKS
jgi:hypothetical protein